jgi:hypothetical protein
LPELFRAPFPLIARGRLVRTTPVSTLILAAIVAGLWTHAASQTLVTVHIHVDTAYDDSPSSVTFISHLINEVPPRTETLMPGESLSAFILRIYGVSTYDQSSPSYLPRTYAVLEAKVLALNAKTNASQLQAGTIFAPQLPKKALAYFNPARSQNRVPFISAFESIRSRVAEPSSASVADVVSVRTRAPLIQAPSATQSADLEIAVTPLIGRSVLKDPILSGMSTALSFPFTAHLASVQANTNNGVQVQDHLVLAPADSATIRILMTTKSQRYVPLFILDTGWPTAADYSISRTHLKTILSTIWSKCFAGVHIPQFSDQQFLKPINPHSTIVQRALAEFENLDPNQHVEVIYIPLTQEQNSGDLLGLLLQTSYLLMYQKEHPGAPIENKVVLTAKQDADAVVKSLPKQWQGESVNTDKALLDAVLRVGSTYSEINQSGFVVNESWTVAHEEYFVYYPNPPEGIVVAAAGNLGQNINSAEVDFSQRCSTAMDTLAVMNLRPTNGLLCCSSKIDERDLPSAMAAGFDGEVSGTDCASLCGTSFAAPRVAWIIAAGDTLRGGEYKTDRWIIDIKSRLFAARTVGTSGYAATWLDAARYLSLNQ